MDAIGGIRSKSGALAIGLALSLGVWATTSSAQEGPVKVGDFPSGTLQIMAPASAGGGWDGTARAIQNVLQTDGIAAQPIEVSNVPGAGGTVGLLQHSAIKVHDGVCADDQILRHVTVADRLSRHLRR